MAMKYVRYIVRTLVCNTVRMHHKEIRNPHEGTNSCGNTMPYIGPYVIPILYNIKCLFILVGGGSGACVWCLCVYSFLICWFPLGVFGAHFALLGTTLGFLLDTLGAPRAAN